MRSPCTTTGAYPLLTATRVKPSQQQEPNIAEKRKQNKTKRKKKKILNKI